MPDETVNFPIAGDGVASWARAVQARVHATDEELAQIAELADMPVELMTPEQVADLRARLDVTGAELKGRHFDYLPGGNLPVTSELSDRNPGVARQAPGRPAQTLVDSLKEVPEGESLPPLVRIPAHGLGSVDSDDDEAVSQVQTMGDGSQILRVPREDGSESTLKVSETRTRTPAHSPAEALRAHVAYYDWMTRRTSRALEMSASTWGAQALELGEQPNQERHDPRSYIRIQHSLLSTVLDSAQTVFVSSHMQDLIDGMVAKLGDDEFLGITWDDLPSPTGLVVLERPIHAYKTYDFDRFVQVRGVAWKWYPKGHLHAIVQDVWLKDKAKVPIQLVSAHASAEADPADLAKMTASPMQLMEQNGGVMLWPLFDAGEFLLEQGSLESWGSPPFVHSPVVCWPARDEEANMSAAPDHVQVVGRFTACLFRIMWQRLIRREYVFPQRPLRREAERKMPSLKDGELKIIHLRAYEAAPPRPTGEEGEGPGMWHTVIVRGHWRQQWYRSLGPARTDVGAWNPDSHRRIWIDPHLRGDGPLVTKHEVSAVVR